MKIVKVLLYHLPFSLGLTLFLWGATLLPELGLQGVAVNIYSLVAMAVLIAEFARSADILPMTFIVNLINSIVAVVSMSSLVTYMLLNGSTFGFQHYVTILVVLANSVLATNNAYRTSLRNIGVGSLSG